MKSSSDQCGIILIRWTAILWSLPDELGSNHPVHTPSPPTHLFLPAKAGFFPSPLPSLRETLKQILLSLTKSLSVVGQTLPHNQYLHISSVILDSLLPSV